VDFGGFTERSGKTWLPTVKTGYQGQKKEVKGIKKCAGKSCPLELWEESKD
jgi:hypothetical protein